MKSPVLLLIVLIFFNSGNGYATYSYLDKIIKSPDNRVFIHLSPWEHNDNAAIILMTHDGVKVKKIKLNEIMTDDDREQYAISTAGIDWYINSISFFSKNHNYFIIRLRWGKIVAINLTEMKVHLTIENGLIDEVFDMSRQIALSLLKSEDPKERQTGAIACGQLKVKESISSLKFLLRDDSYEYEVDYLTKKRTKKYYVRRAAEAALKLIGEH